MLSLSVLRSRGTSLAVAVAIVAGGLLVAGAPPSQAAAPTVTYSNAVAGVYATHLAPGNVYAWDNTVLSAPVGPGPTIGTFTRVASPGVLPWDVSGARVVWVDSGALKVVDRGKAVPAPALPAGLQSILTGGFTGTWMLTYGPAWALVSLDGTVQSLDDAMGSITNANLTQGWDYRVVAQLGSLYAVETKAWHSDTPCFDFACEVTDQITMVVRDAAAGGRIVGPTMTLPASAAPDGYFRLCSLQPGQVLCSWTVDQAISSTVSHVTELWIARLNYLTGATTTTSIAMPAVITSAAASTYTFANPHFGDGVVAVQYGYTLSGVPGQQTVIQAYDLNDLTHPVGVGTNTSYVEDVDGNRILLSTNDGSGTIQIAQLSAGGASAPYLIGVIQGKNTVTALAPLTLDLDLTKTVQAGTLTITDPSGKVVGSVATPASPDGALRGLSWTPPAGVASGTYTWTLNAKDAGGKTAVNNVGDGPATGTFTVVGSVSVPSVPMYRLCNPITGEHFYTASAEEAQIISVFGDQSGDMSHGCSLVPGTKRVTCANPAGTKWTYEGIGFYASTSGTPVQRWAAIPGTDAAGHVFTPYPDEQAAIQASGKWRLEDSAAFFSGGGVDLWRAFNPYTGQHLFSTNRVEEITPLTQLTGPATWVLEAPSGLFVAGEGRQPFSGDGVTNA